MEMTKAKLQLEYSLDYTKEGWEKKNQGSGSNYGYDSHSGGSFGGSSYSYKKSSKYGRREGLERDT